MFFPKIFFTLKWFPKSEIHGSCVVQFQITNMYLVQIHCVWKKKKRIHCSELSKFVDVILKIAFQRNSLAHLELVIVEVLKMIQNFVIKTAGKRLILFSAVHRNRTPFLWFEQIAKHVLLEKGIVWIHIGIYGAVSWYYPRSFKVPI